MLDIVNVSMLAEGGNSSVSVTRISQLNSTVDEEEKRGKRGWSSTLYITLLASEYN